LKLRPNACLTVTAVQTVVVGRQGAHVEWRYRQSDPAVQQSFEPPPLSRLSEVGAL